MELCEGRDLHSALQVRAAGSQERLFSWGRRGKRVALDVAKVSCCGDLPGSCRRLHQAWPHPTHLSTLFPTSRQ